VITFDAPFVLALAPLVGGAAWFGAAWVQGIPAAPKLLLQDCPHSAR